MFSNYQVTDWSSLRGILKVMKENYTLTEALLDFVLLKLSDKKIEAPYDASCISLNQLIIQNITRKLPIIEELVKNGMLIRPDDITTAVEHLQNSDAKIFDFIVSQYIREESFLKCINLACSFAIKNNKVDFIIILLNYGSTPSPDELSQVSDIDGHPSVRRYLKNKHSPIEGNKVCLILVDPY